MYRLIRHRRGWHFVLAAVLAAAGASVARAGIPSGFSELPPFVPTTPPPPQGVDPLPPILVDPPPEVPVDPPPPVRNTPEPGTLILGALGAGIAGIAARRKKK